jgi:hypothetical protein
MNEQLNTQYVNAITGIGQINQRRHPIEGTRKLIHTNLFGYYIYTASVYIYIHNCLASSTFYHKNIYNTNYNKHKYQT